MNKVEEMKNKERKKEIEEKSTEYSVGTRCG